MKTKCVYLPVYLRGCHLVVTFDLLFFWSTRKQRGGAVAVPHLCLPDLACADGQLIGKGVDKLLVIAALQLALAFKGDVPCFCSEAQMKMPLYPLFQLLLFHPLFSMGTLKYVTFKEACS